MAISQAEQGNGLYVVDCDLVVGTEIQRGPGRIRPTATAATAHTVEVAIAVYVGKRFGRASDIGRLEQE